MNWLSRLTALAGKRRPRAASWGLALVIFGGTIALRMVLAPWIRHLPFLIFYPSLLLTTAVCGVWPAMTVLVLITVTVVAFFIPTPGTIVVSEPQIIAGTIGFVLIGLSMIVIVSNWIAYIGRLQRANLLQESLFQELQHRVSNNMQIIASTLDDAKRRLTDPGAIEVIDNAAKRITTLSQLHRRLYDPAAYALGLQLLIEDILDNAFAGLPVAVTVNVNCASFAFDQMTSIALLVNESAANAAKHVFRQGLGGRFDVEILPQPQGDFQLVITDDGPGINDQPVADGGRQSLGQSLGMSLMKAFAAQLGGTLHISEGPAPKMSVRFQPKPSLE